MHIFKNLISLAVFLFFLFSLSSCSKEESMQPAGCSCPPTSGTNGGGVTVVNNNTNTNTNTNNNGNGVLGLLCNPTTFYAAPFAEEFALVVGPSEDIVGDLLITESGGLTNFEVTLTSDTGLDVIVYANGGTGSNDVSLSLVGSRVVWSMNLDGGEVLIYVSNQNHTCYTQYGYQP